MNIVRRHNRPPTSSEVNKIRQLVEIQHESMKILRQNGTDYETAAQEAKEAIKAHERALCQARARHGMAIKLLDALKQGLHMIVGIEGTITDLDLDQTIVSDQLKKEEPGEMSQIIETKDTAAKQLQRHIEVLEVSARNTAEAAAKAEEELQGAYTVEALCLDALVLCRMQINEMQNSIHTKMGRHRAI
jgi:chromosome segregation ATPase